MRASRAPGVYRVHVLEGPARDSLDDPGYQKAHENDLPPVTITKGRNPPLQLVWERK